MSNAYLVRVMTGLLLAVMAVLVGTAWLLLGILSERHPWRYRVYRLVNVLLTVGLVAIAYYIFLGPGRSLLGP